VQNVCKKAIDGLAIELIGVTGLTYLESNSTVQIRPLPAHSARLDLRSALQPQALAHIDVRKYLLAYLTKLRPQLPDQIGPYTTVVNMVLAPKATTEATPSPAGLEITKNDRRLITVKFIPGVLDSIEARTVTQSEEVAHRVYGN
jgi:hypothetical protein